MVLKVMVLYVKIQMNASQIRVTSMRRVTIQKEDSNVNVIQDIMVMVSVALILMNVRLELIIAV